MAHRGNMEAISITNNFPHLCHVDHIVQDLEGNMEVKVSRRTEAKNGKEYVLSFQLGYLG